MTKSAFFRKLITMLVFPEDLNKNAKFERNNSILYFQLVIRVFY